MHRGCCVERRLQRTTSRTKSWLGRNRRVRVSLVAALRTRLTPQIFGPDRGSGRGWPDQGGSRSCCFWNLSCNLPDDLASRFIRDASDGSKTGTVGCERGLRISRRLARVSEMGYPKSRSPSAITRSWRWVSVGRVGTGLQLSRAGKPPHSDPVNAAR